MKEMVIAVVVLFAFSVVAADVSPPSFVGAYNLYPRAYVVWRSVSGADSYIVERAPSGRNWSAGTYVVVGQTPGTYLVDVPGDGAWYYRVRTVKGGVTSAPSKAAWVSIKPLGGWW